MSPSDKSAGECKLNTAQLFEVINQQLKTDGLAPIPNATMASRCTLRFNVDKQRGVDFSKPEVSIPSADLDLLMKMIDELFEVSVRKFTKKFCIMPQAAPKPTAPPPVTPPPSAAPAAPAEEEGKGVLSRIKGIFKS